MSGFTSWRLVCHPGPEGSYSFAQVQSVSHHFDTQWYMDGQTETASQQLQHPGAVAILNQPLVNNSQVQTPVAARHRLQATEGLKLRPVDKSADRLEAVAYIPYTNSKRRAASASPNLLAT